MTRFYTLLLLICTIPTWAAYVSPDGALERLHHHNIDRLRITNISRQYRIYDIFTDSCGNRTVYLFDSGDGFVVTPADDVFPPVLGYGDGRICDEAGNMPPGFCEWLQHMNRQVSEAVALSMDEVGFHSVGEAIAPLCTTSWGQGDPFNLECPEYAGEKCLSGCVATAMAQVMKYHEWPLQGKGELEYWSDKIAANIYTDFSQYTFDWENMVDDYSSAQFTEQQRQSVARLLRGLGGSVRMNYSPTASGADVIDAAQALINNWGYSSDIRYSRRNWFTLREWYRLLHDALKNYGPILYSGFSISSGHAFVCDGYDGEGLFHINWGWEGLADGYFAIDILDPYGDGKSWATGYNVGQSAILNIHPSTPENQGTPEYDLWVDTYYVTPAVSYGDPEVHILHPGDSFKMNGACSNYGPFVIPAGSKFGTLFTSLYTGHSVPSNIVELESDLEVYQSFDRNIKIVPGGLPDGLYSLENDVYIESSGWGHCIVPIVYTRYCALVENNGCDICFIEAGYSPGVESTDIPDKIDIRSQADIRATLINRMPYNRSCLLRAELVQDGYVKGWSSPFPATFAPEEVIDYDLKIDNWTWQSDDVSHDGDYLLCLSMRNPYGDIWLPIVTGKDVKVSGSSAVNAVEVDEKYQDTDLYDLYGHKVSNATDYLPPGIYLRRQNTTVSKLIIR